MVIKTLIIIFIIVGTIYAIDNDIVRGENELWLIIAAVFLTIYFLDDSVYKQVHPEKTYERKN